MRPFEQIDMLLEPVRLQEKLPAIAAAVANCEGILAAGVAGVRRAESDERAMLDDCFHIGSCTKAVTATAIATLVERSQLSWTSAIGDVLSVLNTSICPKLLPVTLEQLLLHRGGIAPFRSAEGQVEQRVNRAISLSGTRTEQRRRFSSELLQYEPVVEPGSVMLYSNAGYGLAATMAEVTTGQVWEDLVQERVFLPLGMASGRFGWPATPEDSHQPWGHAWNKEKNCLVANAPDHPYRVGPAMAAAGGICCSIEDFARFIQSHLQGLRGRSPLLSRETFLRLHSPQENYAMGWNVAPLSLAASFWNDAPISGCVPGPVNDTMSSHAGSAGTFFAQAILLHDAGIGFVVATNSGTGENAVGVVPGILMKRFLRRGPAAEGTGTS